MTPPCLYCMDRKISCHDKCKRYQEYKSERDKLKITKKEMDFNNYMYDAITRMQSVKSSN